MSSKHSHPLRAAHTDIITVADEGNARIQFEADGFHQAHRGSDHQRIQAAAGDFHGGLEAKTMIGGDESEVLTMPGEGFADAANEESA